MHYSSGALHYYLVVIALEIAMVCGLRYGDASVCLNHAKFAHDLTSFELGQHSCMRKRSARSLRLPSSSHRLPSWSIL